MQTRRLRYSLGKWGQKGSVDFEKEDWGNCYTLVLGVEEKCRVEPVCFLVVFCWFFLVGLFVFWGVFCDKKRRAFKSSLDLYFHPLIIEFFLLCPATIQSRWKDTKIIDVARGRRRWGGGRLLEAVLPMRGKWITWRKGLPGDWWSGETMDFIYFQMKVFTDLGPWKKSLFVFLG